VDQPEAYRAPVEELRADPSFSEGQMMGMPALKVGSKMFGGLYEDELVVKVGKERAEQLFELGRARPFDPSGRGRAMGGWALVGEPTDDWLALADEAKTFTASA
jgi:TfoX/Sxy family transcriptional regulator of competence genes